MNPVNFVGALFLAAIGVGLVFCLFAVGVARLQDVYRRSVNRAVDRELRQHGVQMGQLVSWFNVKSIDQAATWAAIAEELANGRWPDVAYVRNEGMHTARARLLKLWEVPRKEASR